MEKINFKVLFSIIEGSPFLSSKFSTRLSNTLSKLSAASYHDDSWGYRSNDENVNRNSRYSRQNNRRNYDDGDDGYFVNRSKYSNYNRDDGGGDYRTRYPRFSSYNENSGFQRRNKFQIAGDNLQKPDFGKIELIPFEKNFYVPHNDVENRSREEIENYRKLHNLTLQGKYIPNPIMKFTEYEFPKEIKSYFQSNGFEAPTPIQAQGWPIALSGYDIIGIGQTGSGKTLGFTFPGFVHIRNQHPLKQNDGPVGLVLAPTRELAQQIHQVADKIFRSGSMRTACLYGGASKNVQMNSLDRTPSLCIATPGRLLDFLEMGVTNLRKCTYLVVDEADRMLDMGFEPQIRRIVDQIRPDRQTLMWSATWPKDVQELARDFLSDYIQINVGSTDLFANPDIKQEVEVCDSFDKQKQFLSKMAQLENDQKILVFTQTKAQADWLERRINQTRRFNAVSIHGDRSQLRRDDALRGFRQGKYSVLVATDVAARGLDVNDITLVINYDFPPTIEDYIHRIGRTARAGKSGLALSFVTQSDNVNAIKDLIALLNKGNFEVPPELLEMTQRSSGRAGFKVSRYRRQF